MNTDDLNFAYKVRHALNEKAEQLPASTSERLAAARKAALARKKPDAPAPLARSAFAGLANRLLGAPGKTLGRLSLAIPALALIAGLATIYQAQQDQRVTELAELDAALLSDELPLSAYLDHGFNAYLSQADSERPQGDQ
jgi:hypothetical protein